MKKILGVCMAVVLLLCGCGKTETVDIPELVNPVGVDMDTAVVVKMDLSGITSFSAQIVPTVEQISFLSSGSIDELKVSIGDHVKKGQLLATLAGTSGKAKSLAQEIKNLRETNEDANKQSRYDIDIMEQKLETLKKQLKKAKKTSEKNNIRSQIVESEEDIKIAEEKLAQQKELQQLEIRQKETDLAEAKKGSKNSKLYSTIDGEVIGTTGGTGYMVQGGNTAVQVANMDKPRLKTTYIPDSKLGKASSYVAVVDGKKYEVEAQEQKLTPEEIQREQYPSNTWFDFIDKNVHAKVGKSATIDLYMDSVKDALVVPANAVLSAKEETYVYLVEGDAKVKTVVTTGTKTDAYVQIVTGVKEGDVVYVES